ncbi:aldehyde dehydrogenase family protein [Streptomyces sp. NPDC002680]|uniref:aldehyde dehydrogenase family protein n=1 Tax=Streptomyces sp. NPDC002680 TaxID=3364659 RepID=UPI00368F801D
MTDFTMTINGTAVSSASTFGVINPATAEVFAQAPACDRPRLEEAMAAARTAYLTWKTDDKTRRVVLREMADALEAATDRLALVLTAEQGKSLGDARQEIGHSVVWLRYYADLETPREVVQDDEHGFAEVVRRPLGVVAAITPWNFPIALATWKIAPALRAGNTMVLKPSPFTPLTTLLLGEVWRDVVPPGVFNVVSGPEPLGTWMTGHPATRKVSFTGSTAVGKRVAASTADDLKRLTLELGGNDPAIVLDDADPEQIADSLFWGAFVNNGQLCFAVKRVYVHERRHADLVAALAARAQAVRVGDGAEPDVQLGPLNNKPQFDRVRDLVGDALAHGAVAAAGGKPLDRPGYFFEPTILTGVTDGSRIVDEEQFGPALPVVSYNDLDDVIERANASEFGLTASVWSPDLDRASSVAARLDCGQVSVNVHGGAVRPDLPFGGHKWSGIGVENGPWGLHGFTELQVLARPARQALSGN